MAGKLLNIEKNIIPINNIIFEEIDYKFEDFFNRINPKINSLDSIKLIREETKNIIQITIKLEKYLKNKIEYISKKYEGKLSMI